MIRAAQCQTLCWGRLVRIVTLLLLSIYLENVTPDIAMNEKYCKKSPLPPSEILQSCIVRSEGTVL